MSKTESTPKPAEPAKGEEEAAPSTSEPDWKAEARKWEARAKENKDASDRLKKLEDAEKSEMTKAQEAATSATKDAEAARLEADRFAVALTKGLTADQAKRLIGATREELESDADLLLKDIGNQASKPPRAASQGLRRDTSPTEDTDREFSRQLFGRAD